ncbi:uroporphyrinogen-III synthase [Hoeflea alexandrii]|uniref:uroporphyrinogen-III synthase n=1 Tax=Hoeflea alexandrii TaxID=288436 RepID=UPI0022AF6431|nr:uroporphyrinogen-III synthase [Hoeflea alexandrii]MCZ4289587.1 uroporphyrinogen-III synthase [Hoeflea alexandrii]
MRVLVTRPEPGGQRTAERLAGLGHDPVRMPLFETVVTARPGDLPPAETISGLIATSARAFAMFGQGGVSGTGLAGVPVYTVGPATAQAARDAGFLHVEGAGGTAKALSESLIRLRSQDVTGGEASGPGVRKGALVYLAGVPRTAVIETALEADEPGSRVIDCYRMAEISYSTDILKSDFLSPPPDVVMLYSANAARRLSALLDAANLAGCLDSTRFLCLSPAIASQLRKTWQDRSVVAGRPDEDSLLASLAGLG